MFEHRNTHFYLHHIQHFLVLPRCNRNPNFGIYTPPWVTSILLWQFMVMLVASFIDQGLFLEMWGGWMLSSDVTFIMRTSQIHLSCYVMFSFSEPTKPRSFIIPQCCKGMNCHFTLVETNKWDEKNILKDYLNFLCTTLHTSY